MSPASISLSRAEFRAAVFHRDQHRCVLCSEPAVDSHHLIDRSLWGDSNGYYLPNGVSLCAKHHLDAEMTVVSCEELRSKAGITEILLPEHFSSEDRYDHWGNIIQPNGTRIRGELFNQENVQKVLKDAGLLSSFVPYVKFPRTYHVPWSENLQNDDRMHQEMIFFLDKEIVVSEKLDGENTSMYTDRIHARSVDSGYHESRNWVKALHGRVKHLLDEGWRICGENMYAKHSIHYHDLVSYFYVFSIWDENNVSLSWDDVQTYCKILGLSVVPEIFRGTYHTSDALREGLTAEFEAYKKKSKDPVEGYVIRVVDSYPYREHRLSTAKFVRKGHVQSSDLWMYEKVVPNEIIK